MDNRERIRIYKAGQTLQKLDNLLTSSEHTPPKSAKIFSRLAHSSLEDQRHGRMIRSKVKGMILGGIMHIEARRLGVDLNKINAKREQG